MRKLKKPGSSWREQIAAARSEEHVEELIKQLQAMRLSPSRRHRIRLAVEQRIYEIRRELDAASKK